MKEMFVHNTHFSCVSEPLAISKAIDAAPYTYVSLLLNWKKELNIMVFSVSHFVLEASVFIS